MARNSSYYVLLPKALQSTCKTYDQQGPNHYNVKIGYLHLIFSFKADAVGLSMFVDVDAI